MDQGREPIGDEELIFRRIPASTGWYDPARQELRSEAFLPTKHDTTGLSVARSRYTTPKDAAARGRPGKQYFVAVLRAIDIRNAQIVMEPRPDIPQGYDPSHAELPQLHAENRMESLTLERAEHLREMCVRVDGPFEASASE